MTPNLNINIRNILIGAIIIVVLIIGSMIYYSQFKIKTPQAKNLLAEQMDLLSDADKYAYQEQIAALIDTKNFVECNRVGDKLYKTVCVNNIALKLAEETKDISYCQRIDGKLISIQDCERQIIIPQSIKKEDIEICQKTQDQELQKECQNNFYSQLSIKKDDITVCDQSAQDQQEFCYNHFYLTTKNFAENHKDFDCDALRGDSAKSDCQKFKEISDSQSADKFFCIENMKSLVFISYCDLLIRR